MPTTINASNTSGGAIITPDGSGVLELQSGGVTGLTVSGANVTVAGTLTATGGMTGTLPVANGGTGAVTLTGVVKGNGTSAFTAGTVSVSEGGTGAATLPANNVLIGNGTSAVAAVAPGTNGNVLTSNGTNWVSAAPSSPVITALNQDVTITATGTIAANTIGFRGLPQNSQTSAYILALSDQGKHISITTGGITIPANSSVPFPIGSEITFFNNSGSSQFIGIATDTLRLSGLSYTGASGIPQYGLATCVKVDATTWVISGGAPFTIEYIVVAGGGGGARYGGGGGAGGFITGSFFGTLGTTYTVTIGSGGAATTSGNNSSLGANIAIGGGRAGAFNTPTSGSSGGSGGGGGGSPGYGLGTGGAGTVGQGNAGGGGGNYNGGGGGGAGAAGSNAVNATVPGTGNGGIGVSSSISGSSVFYAGGGGGRSSGLGGAGGGGNGNSNFGNPGTANTGGGAGSGSSGGSSGGSGIVIMRILDSIPNASSITGSPVLTITGGYKIYTFNASGTITW